MKDLYKFKDGDKVYLPEHTCNVCGVVWDGYSENYPIDVGWVDTDGNEQVSSFTEFGLNTTSSTNPSIFLATEDNRIKLEALYGKPFEVYVDKKSSEYTRKLLRDHGKPILCYVSDLGDYTIGKRSGVALVEDCVIDGGEFITNNRVRWLNAVPVSSFDTDFI